MGLYDDIYYDGKKGILELKHLFDYDLKKIPLDLINNVKELTFYNCFFDRIPFEFYKIEKLSIESCKYIKYIPDHFINLKEININGCENLKELPNTLINLNKIYISYRSDIIIPENIIKIPNIYINKFKIKNK